MRLTHNRIRTIMAAYDDIKFEVSRVYRAYHAYFFVGRDNGLVSWFIDGDTVHVTYDMSACGHYDEDTLVLKFKWLLMSDDELNAEFKIVQDAKDEAARIAKETKAAVELAAKRKLLEKLKAELE